MRAILWIGMGLLLVSCGANPLLKNAASDFAPVRQDANWVYVKPDGSSAFSATVVANSIYQGKDAFQLRIDIPSSASVLQWWARTGSTLERWDSSLGWVVEDKLPYVLGNRWDLPSTVANRSFRRFVDGQEQVATPAGTFNGCFRVKTEQYDYNSGTGLTVTTGTFTWAAPDVGEVKGADINAAGDVTVTHLLSSYSKGTP